MLCILWKSESFFVEAYIVFLCQGVRFIKAALDAFPHVESR